MKNKRYLTLKYRLKFAEAANKQLRKQLKRMRDVVSNMDWNNTDSNLRSAKSVWDIQSEEKQKVERWTCWAYRYVGISVKYL